MKIADFRPEEWSRPKIKKYIKKEGHAILLARENKRIVGYVGLKEVENEDEVIRMILGNRIDVYGCAEWIAVHPSHRGRGIASLLLGAAEKWMKKRKRAGVWLDCRMDVIALYEKNKYTLAGSYEGTSKSGQSCAKYVFVKNI